MRRTAYPTPFSLKFLLIPAAFSASPAEGAGKYSQELLRAKFNCIAGKKCQTGTCDCECECAQQYGEQSYFLACQPLTQQPRMGTRQVPGASGCLCSRTASLTAEQLQGFPSSPCQLPVPAALQHCCRMLWAFLGQGLCVLPIATSFRFTLGFSLPAPPLCPHLTPASHQGVPG